jgi:beta-lactam-binding protein with PASTA domain
MARPMVGSVIGLSLADAHAAIAAVGASVREREVEVTEPSLVGRVVAQRPEAGEQMPETQVVDLDVGRSVRPQVRVPDVAGRTTEEARVVVAGLGLKMRTAEEEVPAESGVTSRDILRQAPTAGTDVSIGSEVVVTIARPIVVAPAVVGQTEAEARRLIESAGLQAAVSEHREALAARGSVIEQRPSAGSRVVPGTRVELLLSTGPRPAATPPVPLPSAPRQKRWEKQGHTLEVSDLAIIDEHQRLAREVGVLTRRGSNPSLVVRAALRAFERLRLENEDAWLRYLREVRSTGEPGQG